MARGIQSDARGPGRSSEAPEQEIFKVLAHQRRRYLLHALMRERGPTTVGDLAEQIAAWEYEIDVGEITRQERKRLYTALQQTHLPMLDEAGLVDFDKRHAVVEPTSSLEEFEIYAEIVGQRGLPWSTYYLALAGGSAVLVVLAGWDIWPIALLPDLAWAIFVVLAFATVAIIHTYDDRRSKLGSTEKPPELT